MNKLNVEKKAAAVGMLCEGSSIRSVERITGIHRDMVMRLGVRIGQGCRQIAQNRAATGTTATSSRWKVGFALRY